jgi:hypothetical protein
MKAGTIGTLPGSACALGAVRNLVASDIAWR